MCLPMLIGDDRSLSRDRHLTMKTTCDCINSALGSRGLWHRETDRRSKPLLWEEPWFCCSAHVGTTWDATSIHWSVKVWVTQSCLTLRDAMDRSPPGSSVRRILQARILEWAAIPFPGASSQPRDQTWVSYIAGGFVPIWTTREAH